MSDLSDQPRPSVTLPFFSDVVEQFAEALQHQIQDRIRRDGLLARIKAHVIHEGQSSRIARSSTDVDNVAMEKAEAFVTIKHQDLEAFGLGQVIQHIDEMAEQFRSSKTKLLFKKLDEATAKTGNVIRGEGSPLTNEILLQALDTVEHSFDNPRSPSNLFMVIHPDMADTIRRLDEEMKSSPDLKRQHDAMMGRKYEQFRDREMDRNLAG
jgi:hypothetical protein